MSLPGAFAGAPVRNPTLADPHTSDGTGTGSFVSQLTGLSGNTTYYVRAYATNSAGTSYGNQQTFITLLDPVLPTVTTDDATNITQTTATSGGNIVSDGGATVTARGVCWSTSSNPTTANSFTTNGSGTGTFISALTGLTSNTQYYVRAYATNTVGTSYGNEVTFTTISPYPCQGITTVNYGGQTYNTVEIGTQCWMKENLNVGTMIPGNQSQSGGSPIEKYCYDDDPANCNVYGGLYQWDEMMLSSTTPGVKGICPDGWHIPTDIEWTILTNFLGGESVAGGKMKEAGTTHWLPPNTGATNSSGFTALPGGMCFVNGVFNSLTGRTDFWSSSQEAASTAWVRYLFYDDENVNRAPISKSFGLSARCIKD